MPSICWHTARHRSTRVGTPKHGILSILVSRGYKLDCTALSKWAGFNMVIPIGLGTMRHKLGIYEDRWNKCCSPQLQELHWMQSAKVTHLSLLNYERSAKVDSWVNKTLGLGPLRRLLAVAFRVIGEVH